MLNSIIASSTSAFFCLQSNHTIMCTSYNVQYDQAAYMYIKILTALASVEADVQEASCSNKIRHTTF